MLKLRSCLSNTISQCLIFQFHSLLCVQGQVGWLLFTSAFFQILISCFCFYSESDLSGSDLKLFLGAPTTRPGAITLIQRFDFSSADLGLFSSMPYPIPYTQELDTYTEDQRSVNGKFQGEKGFHGEAKTIHSFMNKHHLSFLGSRFAQISLCLDLLLNTVDKKISCQSYQSLDINNFVVRNLFYLF